MGWNLPVRRMDLEFDLLPPGKRGARPRIGVVAIARLRKEHGHNKLGFLRDVYAELKLLNRYALPPGQRLTLNALALKAVFPLVLELIAQYSKPVGIPDEKQRQESLDLAADIARALTVGYKLVLQHYYDAPRFIYARNRKRVYRSAFRILELIRLEQRLLGLRYRQLCGRAWQDAHTVFAVLADYESVDFPMPRLDAELRGTAGTRMTCPHDVYAAILAYALLDATTWPAEQMGFIDSYRESLDKPLSISLGNAVQSPDTLFARAYHAGAPSVTPSTQDKGPLIGIDCRVLANSIRGDYREILLAKTDGANFTIPRLLAPLQDAYRVAIASLMNRNINQRMRWLDLDRPGDPVKGLHIYVGFEDIEHHLTGIFSQDENYRYDRRLADTLADRSALFGEDHTATEESLWQILYSDERLFGLQTQETAYTTRMGIGSLLAYGMGDQDRARPRLGSVSRILRPRPGSVLLEIRRLASFAEPVKVQKLLIDSASDSEADAVTISGCMVYDRYFGWGLLLPNQEKIWRRTPVVLHRGGHALRFRLGGVKALTQDFILFVLPQPFQNLGVPSYPAVTQERRLPAI